MRRRLTAVPASLVAACVVLLPLGAAGPEPEARYGTGTWDADKLGNHRAVVRVAAAGEAVWAHLPWRRRDTAPQQKNIIVVDAKSGATITNLVRAEVNREFGDLAFQPVAGTGEYFIYYLPFEGSGRSNYPKIVYPPPAPAAQPEWLARNRLTADDLAAGAWRSLAKAEIVEFQAIDEFNSVYPMEVIATAAEVSALAAAHPGSTYLVFPEDRAHPIRMTDDLPQRWILSGAAAPFSGTAARGEFYAFQIGVFAATQAIDSLEVQFGGLTSAAGRVLAPPSGLRCFNLGGVDSAGQSFTQPLAIPRGKVQALWFGLQVPEDAAPGRYAGTVTVRPRGQQPTPVRLALTVSAETIAAAGDDEPWRQSRLRWLDSRLAEDDDLVPPYTAMTVSGTTIGVLGRRVTLGRDGLPASMQSLFAPEMTELSDSTREILAGPIALVVEGRDPAIGRWTYAAPRFSKRARGAVAWEATGTSGPLTLTSRAQMEFDGNIEFVVGLTTSRSVDLSDVRLEIPFARDVAKYMMGLGAKGGLRPASYAWAWNVKNNQDGAWIGDVNAGLQFSLKDDRYVRPLNTNFYTLKPLVMPRSWENGGQGGCRMAERGADVFLVSCYSGSRTIGPADAPLFFNFRLLVTPFKPIDTRAQFSTRYFHAYRPVDEVAAIGATTVNIHHANALNPYINYPFLRPALMKAYVDEAHAKGLKVKIYYTVRELTNRAHELFALRSLGHEVLAPGPGGGFSWLQEHVGSDYIAGWFVPALKDAALINSGVSRWHNYYVEGLDWLVRNIGIDGLYIDDVAFDRFTMKRVRKVLDRGRPGALIDLHSANQFNVRDGFANSANLYLEHFPFLDRLWFGEYFDYGSAPDYWMTEVAGIPFGVMSEMLQDGGNPWRGMVFGMTARMPRVEMRPLWKAWDEFGIVDSRMIGWWVPASPVRTNDPNVLATVYARPGRALVALASWAKEPVKVTLAIDWAALGIDPARATLAAPAIEGFQPALTWPVGGEIVIEPGKGWLLVITHQEIVPDNSRPLAVGRGFSPAVVPGP